MLEINFKTDKKHDMIDITEKVNSKIKDIKEGVALVFTPHATAAIIINENYDPNVCVDILNFLNKAIPEGRWLHDKVDNNAAAHIKAAILGPSENVIIENGKLKLGTWQSLMFVELDGPRERRVIIKIIRNHN